MSHCSFVKGFQPTRPWKGLKNRAVRLIFPLARLISVLRIVRAGCAEVVWLLTVLSTFGRLLQILVVGRFEQ